MSLKLEALLSPISEQQPCGSDYSFSNEFHAIKKAKTQDDLLLDQGDWVSEPKQADWAFVHKQSTELLTEKTKDIRLYTWLMEAWANLYGFEGIAKSIELLQRSLNEYWLQLYPEIEEDDFDQRLGLLQGFINLIPALIKIIPVVQTVPYFNLADYEGLLHQQHQKRKQQLEDDADSANSLEKFEQTLLNTPKGIQYQNYQHFLVILNQWQILKNILDHFMGLNAPSFATIDSQLESLHLTLKKIYKADSFMAAAPASASASSAEISMQTEVIPAVPQCMEHNTEMRTQNLHSFQPRSQNHLDNRKQAMHVLQEISDYFQTNEPHSPVSYMLQKTIRWSQIPLHEWLAQVIKNENPLENVQEMLGVQHDANNDW